MAYGPCHFFLFLRSEPPAGIMHDIAAAQGCLQTFYGDFTKEWNLQIFCFVALATG
jgi:hypothetical protein